MGEMEHLKRKGFTHWVAHGRTGGSIGCSWWIYETIELHCVTWLIEESQSCTCRWILTAIKYRSCLSCTFELHTKSTRTIHVHEVELSMVHIFSGRKQARSIVPQAVQESWKGQRDIFPFWLFFFFLTVIKVQNILHSYDCSTEDSTLPFCITN